MSFWKDKNVLITGVGGFVAFALASKLVKEGANVSGTLRNFDSLTKLKMEMTPEIVNKINFTIGDICDYDFLRRIVNKYEVDVCFHLAAVSTVRICSRDPLVAFRTNVGGTTKVLEACRGSKTTKAVVVASTDKCYGIPQRLPYEEEDVLNGLATYDASKACTDIISRSFAYNYDLPVAVTRCCNVYGPGDLNLTRIIPNTIRRAMYGESAILWSDSESMIREFIYIDDVVNAYMKLAERINDTKGEAFNVGTSEYIKVGDFVKMIFECLDREPLITIKDRDSEFKEIPEQHLNSAKINKVTGWEPMTPLKDGLQKTVDWYVDFFNKREEV